MKNKKLICKISDYGTFQSLALICVNQNMEFDEAICRTLLDFIKQQRPEADAEFEELLQQAEQGTYKPEDPRFGDWGINSNEVWLRPPEALPGHIAVTNEWTKYGFSEVGEEDIASGDYGPQQFIFDQYRKVLKFWRECQKMVEGKDLSTMEDFRQEIPFPEA